MHKEQLYKNEKKKMVTISRKYETIYLNGSYSKLFGKKNYNALKFHLNNAPLL